MEIYASRDVVAALSMKYRGDIRKMEEHVSARADISAEELCYRLSRAKDSYVTMFDKEYPPDLLNIAPAPMVLWYRGNLSLIREMDACIAIVGARKAHSYALEKAKSLAASLAKRGMTIVSGLAEGIDRAALEGALPYGKAVAVIGNEMDYYYPADNEDLQRAIAKHGLLLTEYPRGTPPAPMQFVARNRIIAAISTLTIVAEAKLRSGSLITAAFACSIGHDVGAFPHDVDGDNGCNAIIKDGAFLVENEDDIATILGSKGERFFAKKKAIQIENFL